MGDMQIRNALVEAENFLATLPQAEFETRHDFSPGIYARTILIPADHILTGRIHKTEHLCIMHGDIHIDSEHGGGRFTGYHVFKSMPGVKRIGRTFADTYFTTIHHTEETDIPTIEAELAVDTYAQYEQFLLDNPAQHAQLDYRRFLEEWQMTEDFVQTIVQNTEDQIAMPAEYDRSTLDVSPIHGTGLFATRYLVPGVFIAPARLAGKRTPAGRYTNHSPTPNARMQAVENGDIHLHAIGAIMPGEEITVDYRQAGEENLKSQGLSL